MKRESTPPYNFLPPPYSPADIFIGGAFVREISQLPVLVEPVPHIIASRNGSLWVISRPDLLPSYTTYINKKLDQLKTPLPSIVINEQAGTIGAENSWRADKPLASTDEPISPKNEYKTTPPFLVISETDLHANLAKWINTRNWAARLIINNPPYLIPIHRITRDQNHPTKRTEVTSGLNLLGVLNPARKNLPLHDPLNSETIEIMLYSFAKASKIIKEKGVYIDKNNEDKSHNFGAILGFMNYGPKSGGSLRTAHYHILVYERIKARPFNLGVADDEGNCGRCHDIERKSTQEEDKKRVITETEYAMAYVPETESVTKGDVIRITPKTQKHVSTFAQLIDDPETIRQLAYLTHKMMFSIASEQKGRNIVEPSFNIKLCQDIDESVTSHLYIELITNQSSGFDLVAPQYPLDEKVYQQTDVKHKNDWVSPGTAVENPVSITEKYRNACQLYPPYK